MTMSRMTVALVVLIAPGVPVRPAQAAPVVTCADPRGCPDLVVDASRMSPRTSVEDIAPEDCQVVEGMVQPGTRRLLRFTLTTPNVGAGDLVVGVPATRPELFGYSPCHGHYHFHEYADYRLWTPGEHARYEAYRVAHPELTAAEVLARRRDLRPVTSRKQGFCMIDSVMYAVAPPKFLTCDLQGISVGWADEYLWEIDGQYVDVTGLRAGTYVLEAEVNAERLFEESDYADNRGTVTVTL